MKKSPATQIRDQLRSCEEDRREKELTTSGNSRRFSLILWCRKVYNTFLTTENRRKLSPKAIFLSVALSVFVLGCQEDQYAIEKQYYKATKRAEKIFKNPHTSPPNELQEVVNLLSVFSQKHSQSNLAVEAEFHIARLYIVKAEYEKAREQLKKILDSYSKFKAIPAEALFLIGNSYEIENKWDLALLQYRKIMLEYPLTPRGMDVPIYIAQAYKVKYQPDKMREAYGEAIEHYNSLSGKYQASLLAYRSQLLVAQCYIALDDWQNVIHTLDSILENYKGKINMDGVLMNIATVYNSKLKDNSKAKETLERLIQDYPKSRLINTAKNILKSIEENKK